MKENNQQPMPPHAMFLGPKSENADFLINMINKVFSDYVNWRRNYFHRDPYALTSLQIRENQVWLDKIETELQSVLGKLKDHFPFYSPRYIGHMLSEQAMPAVLGYFAGMLYNPNNVATEAAPVTLQKEQEFGKMICAMLGYNKNTAWAHICSGGTVANIEALWVAREVQFLPLVIREFCKKHEEKYNEILFEFKLESSQTQPLNTKALIGFSTRHVISEQKRFLKCLYGKRLEIEGESRKLTECFFDFMVDESEYSIRRNGYHGVLKKIEDIEKLRLEPVIFIPASYHYSLRKAASILGYGEKSVKLIRLTDKFRIDHEYLESEIRNLNCSKEYNSEIEIHKYVASVIVVAGTTEEGSVDPIHEVHFSRKKLRDDGLGSFWLHVDAAWGGYIRTLFRDDQFKEFDKNANGINEDKIDALANHYIEHMKIKSDFRNDFEYSSDKDNPKKPKTKIPLKVFNWDDKEVVKAFLAIESADSVTIDPHKLGYIPYPAGVVAFRDKEHVKLIGQKASYIFKDGATDITETVGPYILEGSKPGAAALACWLTATTIPLNLRNHGEIIKSTILSAKRFHYYLNQHSSQMFFCFEKEFAELKAKQKEKDVNDKGLNVVLKETLSKFGVVDDEAEKLSKSMADMTTRNKKRSSSIEVLGDILMTRHPFRFIPLYDNIDTNVVCFIVVPMKWQSSFPKFSEKSSMMSCTFSLEQLNKFNDAIYNEFDIKENSRNINTCGFFLSSSTLTKEQYPWSIINTVLQRKGVDIEDGSCAYEAQGGKLFVMRSTIMNPWHETAYKDGASDGIDYFMEFIRELHKVARAKSIEFFC
ncbi:MAG: pyridoxal-dependent decarboxylase [Oscillospiraceae bacterium]|nr:pyridoxal-dependent decarboxylase [Oscillospiraceae bacterium]MCL2279517.1 pyridoxal-dependent decarboxylase [Oscillospiraceae bacterium]